jgi:uncharacterized protein
MRYTTLGARGPRVSRLGFGCMRLPMGEDGRVDRALAVPLLRRAVELGVTYIDTAIFYCQGDSQRAVGEALEGLRDRVVLSTKNHLHSASAEDWGARLDESLEMLRTDYLDIYNFHGLTWETFEQHLAGPDGKLELMKRAKSEGRVRHICCSFHDEPEALVKLAETGEFDAITVQYNLLNRSLEQAIHRCRELGVGIVVMGPVGGGRLGVESARIRDLIGGGVNSTPEAAIRFVLAHPGVHVALSGMSNLEMLEENVRIVSETEPFTPGEISGMEQELVRVKALQGVNCPACGYCQPCPFGVDIPENFRIYNEFKQYGLTAAARKAYAGLVQGAAACVECGACLSKCPQKIPIPDALRKVIAELDDSYCDFGATPILRGVREANLSATIMVRNLRAEPLDAEVSLSLLRECASRTGTVNQSKTPREMPPMMGRAIGSSRSAPRPVEVSTGSSARKVVAVVIRQGRMRRRPASTTLARTSARAGPVGGEPLLDVGVHHHAVVHRDAEERQEPDPDRHAEVHRMQMEQPAQVDAEHREIQNHSCP